MKWEGGKKRRREMTNKERRREGGDRIDPKKQGRGVSRTGKETDKRE